MIGSADALKRACLKLIVFFRLAGLLVAALWPAFLCGEPTVPIWFYETSGFAT